MTKDTAEETEFDRGYRCGQRDCREYYDEKLQALRDPKKIREIMMGSDFEHLKINDEFGFTGEWRMSEKGVLDVIINLIDNNLNE